MTLGLLLLMIAVVLMRVRRRRLVVDEVVVPAAAPPAGKSSKLKRIPGMFRSKPKAEVSLPTCDEFTDFSAAAPVGVAAAVAGVEPTPIARRTRGANRHA